jgi:hypothetical protein
VCISIDRLKGEKHMITYSTNWMGPINEDWIKAHGDCWAAGRIDVHGEEGYPQEIALPPMHDRDWERFSRWLETFETEQVWPLTLLVVEYEKTRPPILWVKEKQMPEPRLVRNAAQCRKCGDLIVSKHRHDFVTCKCGAISVDGGLNYSRRTGNPADMIDMCEYSTKPDLCDNN